MHTERKEIVVHAVKDREFGTEVLLKSCGGRLLVEVLPAAGPALQVELSKEQFEGLSAIATASGNEIEKKYLLREYPGVALTGRAARYRQDYLAIAADGAEVRVRAVDHNIFRLTFKVGTGLARGEAEVLIDEKQYAALLPYASGKVEKDHFEVPGSQFTPEPGMRKFEFNIHTSPLEGLYILEVEADHAGMVPAIEQAVTAHFPRAEDVTENKAYKAATIARKGMPQAAA